METRDKIVDEFNKRWEADKVQREERDKIVDEFNKRWEADIHITDDDGEIISWNLNWILDSEYMNYVCDDWASPRIKEFIQELEER
jgi:hypothetical protein